MATLLNATPKLDNASNQKKKATGSGKKKSKKTVAEKEVEYVRELTKAEIKELQGVGAKSKKKPEKYIMVKTADIEFTQGYIRKCMDKQDDTLAEICHYIMQGEYEFCSKDPGSIMQTGFAMIGIAKKGGKFYSRDNRRLFIAKVLGIEEIPCMLFEWGGEFDIKTGDVTKYKDIETTAEGIEGFIKKQLKKQLQDDEDMREHGDDTEYVVHVPSKSVGLLIGRQEDGYQKTRVGMQRTHKCTISVNSEKFVVGSRLYTPVRVWPRGSDDEVKAERAHAAIKQIKQIVNWGCVTLDEEDKFFPKVKFSNEE